MAQFKVGIKLTAFDRVTTTLKRVSTSLNKMTSSTKRAVNRFKLLQLKTESLRNSLNRMGRGLRNVGSTLVSRLSLPLTAIAGGVIATAASFEKGMNKVRALTGATGKDFLAMRNLAKELGATTKFSATQAAEGMAFLGMAGFNTNEILQATPALLNLAAASNIELGRAADIASNIMGAFNLKATEAGRVADVLAAVTASANVDMEQLSETMKFAGPIAFQFGATLEETAAAAGLLGNLGIQGSNAGTALKRAFLGLASPAGKAAKVLSQIGIRVADSSGNMRRFGDIMTDLGNKLGKLPQQTRLQVLNAVFGKIGITGAAALQRFARTGELEKFTKSMQNVTGRAKQMADIMNEGAAGSLIALKSALEGFAIAIADSGILKMFTDIVKRITAFVRQITKTNPLILKLSFFLGLVVAALGPLLISLGLVVSILPAIITGLSAIGAAIGLLFSPITVVVGLLGLLIFNFDKVKKTAKDLSDVLKDLWVDPKTSLKGFVDFAMDQINTLIDMIKNPTLAFKALGAAITDLIPKSVRKLFTGNVNLTAQTNRVAPEFGAERSAAQVNATSITKKSKLEIEINDRSGGKAKVRGRIDDEDITTIGAQGSLAVGGI